MAEQILECDKCKSREFELLEGYEEKLKESLSTTLRVKASCNDCGYIMEYSSWTKLGERKREWGMII